MNAEVATWNFGVAATVLGSPAAAPVITALGGITTALALAARSASRAHGVT